MTATILPVEKKLIKMYEQKIGAKIDKIVRRSNKAYDLNLEYVADHNGYKVNTRAWLVLGAIADLTDWTSPEVAIMTDYPAMAAQGDWSGVRDTDAVRLWNIFIKFVLPQIR
jgi:hypothetical protein